MGRANVVVVSTGYLQVSTDCHCLVDALEMGYWPILGSNSTAGHHLH